MPVCAPGTENTQVAGKAKRAGTAAHMPTRGIKQTLQIFPHKSPAFFTTLFPRMSVGIEIQPVQKPEKQNGHQNHDNEKQPAKKPDLPLVLRKPAFISMSVHKKLSNQTASKSHA
jgi:hypothetical protein